MNRLILVKAKIKNVLSCMFPGYYAKRFIRMSHKNVTHIYGGYETLSHIKENCEFFLTEAELADKKYLDAVVLDIMRSYFKFGTNANEYFCYKFPDLTDKERNAYLPRKRKDSLIIKQMGTDWTYYLDQLKDKYQFYLLTKKYFAREACYMETPDDYDAFKVLISKFTNVIAKPLRGGCGVGVVILDLKDFENDPQKVFAYLQSYKTPFIVEELVQQDPRMSEWNESSINTLRIPSFRTNKGIQIVYPSVRIGRKGSVVDNAGAGGTFAALDPISGVVISDGYDKRGKSYLKHPDSEKIFMGAQIPDWKNLVSIVEELHQSLPLKHKYIAFDFALSTKGWVLIEGNWGELSMPQVEFGRGLYKEFVDLLNDNR